MLFCLIPNRIVPDAITKIMPCRSKSFNSGCGNSNGIGPDEVTFCKASIE